MEQFFDTLSGPRGGLLIPICFFVVTGIVTIIVAGISQWRKHRQFEMETGLIQEMLQRGMSASEITLVLNARNMKAARPGNLIPPPLPQLRSAR